MPIADPFSWVPDLVNWLSDRIEQIATGAAELAAWIATLVGELFTWIWETTDPIPEAIRAGIAATVVIAALALTVRKIRLLMLARSPRVQISQFTWAGPSAKSEAVWVTSLFLEHLATLQADPVDPLPERAPSAPFVDIVEAVARGARGNSDVALAAGRLFRALWPVAAYEVWGTLRPVPGGGRVSVQLIDHSRGNRTVGSHANRRGEWRHGARDAAMTVAGLLYPRVAKKHRGPWAHWRETIPHRLIDAHREAQECEDGNRFEEAMAAYHRALEYDPANPHLRLKIANLQERLGLYLDAWATYGAIVDEPNWRGWRGPHRRVRLIALYRLAILLGNGRTAEQWVKNDQLEPGEGNLRDDERIRRRKELRMLLKNDSLLHKREPYLVSWPAFAASSGLLSGLRDKETRRTEEGRKAWVAAVFAPGERGESEHARNERMAVINATLQVVALRRLEELDAWLRARPPFRMRQWGEWIQRRPRARELFHRRQLARGTVRLSKLLVRIRIVADAERLAESNPAKVRKVRWEHRWLTLQWPFPTHRVFRKVLHFVAPRRRWTARRADGWQLHYNAACTVAAVLLPGSVWRNIEEDEQLRHPKRGEREIVRRAVRELEEYAFRAGSGHVMAHADWVAIGDPDLQGLAGHEEFELWASHYLPRDLPGRRLRGNVDVNRHTARISYECARAFSLEWRARANRDSIAAPQAVYWWRQERAAWAELGNVYIQRGSWRQRFQAIKHLQEWLRDTDGEHWVHFEHETFHSPPMVRRQLLEAAAAVIGGDHRSGDDAAGPTVVAWTEGRLEHVQTRYEAGADLVGDDGLDPAVERHEALRAARLWARLADALDAELRGEDRAPTTLLEPLRDALADPPPTARA